jgi:hypothetical protein
LPLVAAIGLTGLLAAGDYIAPTGRWWADHPMSGAAISGVLLFVQAAVVLETWLKDREARKLDRISTVAYRSLAQYANDAGRSLLGALNGADLYGLAVPGATRDAVERSLARLERHGYRPCFAEATGSWGNTDKDELDERLRAMCHDNEFVSEMFRTTALQRRRLQEATALWAPVMLTSKATVTDLSRFRSITDALELLQERWRLGGLGSTGHRPSTAVWLDALSRDFWVAIAAYENVRDEFAELAQLPSDDIVRRRAPRLAAEITASAPSRGGAQES